MLTFGFEFEVADGAREVINELYEFGREVIQTRDLHSYHCDCSECAVWPRRDYDPDEEDSHCPPMFHAQYDSSCGGEFITRVLDDFEDMRSATRHLMDSVRAAGAAVNSSCGLHVHVSAFGRQSLADNRAFIYATRVPTAYLLVERYISELIAPGATRNKRDMNCSLLQAARDHCGGDRFLAEEYTETWDQVTYLLRQAISNDRHVDLNVSDRNQTFEFRVFNASAHAWRVQLACRLAVAFVEKHEAIIEACTREFGPGDLVPILCGHRWPTMRPRISMAEFIDIVSEDDEELRRLMLRQCMFVRQQYRPEFDLDTTDFGGDEAPLPKLPEPEPEFEPLPASSYSRALRDVGYTITPGGLYRIADPVSPDEESAVDECDCPGCERIRQRDREMAEEDNPLRYRRRSVDAF